MDILILQKSITDLKSPVRRNAYSTEATLLGELIDEMVAKNAAKSKSSTDYIAIFDAINNSGGDRFAYGKCTAKFNVTDMQAFARQAFEDKIYLVKNITSGVMYTTLDEPLQLTNGDELALIKLKYIRGAI